ncbi:MAG: radical SAM protein [Desulfatiglandales bacterium]
MKQTIRSLKHIRRPAYALLKRRVPGQLVIQFTDRCNALCPQCGMRIRETFTRSKLSISVVKRILDCAAQRNVSIVSFTGGEPFLYLDELALLIQRAGDHGIPYIRTGTNGFLFMNDFFFINAKEAQTYPCGYRGEETLGLYGDADWTPPPEGKACSRCD